MPLCNPFLRNSMRLPLCLSLLLSLRLFAQTPAPDTAQVAKLLDAGGVQYSIGSGAYEWAALQPTIEFFSSILSAGAAESGEFPPETVAAFVELPKLLGLHEVKARGSSTIALPAGGFRSRWIVETTPAASGLLWKLHGAAFDPSAEIRRLPPSAAAVGRFSLNAPLLRDEIIRFATRAGVPAEVIAEAQAGLAETGFPIDTLLEGIRSGVTFAICFNKEFTWNLPVPGGFQTPETGIVFSIGDKDAVLTTFLRTVLAEEGPMVPLTLEVEGVTVSSLPIPAPVPTAVALQFAHADGRLLFATSPLLMQQLLQRVGGKADAAHPLLARLGSDMPKQVVQLWVCDEQLPLLVGKGVDSALENSPAGEMPGVGEMLGFYKGMINALSVTAVTSREGNLLHSVLLHDFPIASQGSGANLMAAPAMVGMLAAIAVPAFSQARAQARGRAQEVSCINNLRMIDSAKDQWAIENSKSTGDAVTGADIADYIRGGVPVCPQGGEYKLNAIGEKPTCSVPGHSLD
jgi:hypothetical protein